MTLMMSVSGVRGLIGQTLTPTLAAELACAFGTLHGPGRVVVGRDSRPSGPMVESAIVAGLLATCCEPVQVGIVSTPAVGVMVRHCGAVGGVVITASHNPLMYNGIKFLTAEGRAPAPETARRIFDVTREKAFQLADVDALRACVVDESAADIHVAETLKILTPEQITPRRYRIVLDSVNGAGGAEGRQLLEKLGCEVVGLNEAPTGRFAHPPEPRAEHLEGLCDAVRTHSADAGFALDPDADRLAIVDEGGRYIGEEYTLALAARHLFTTRPGPAAANLSTSRMIDDLAAAAGGSCRVFRTPVGEANVVDAIHEHGCVFGGEGNGGIIDPRVGLIRDSLVAMGLVLELMAVTGKRISELVAELPAYTMIKTQFTCPAERIARFLEQVRQAHRDERLNDSDGVRIDLEDGWVHVRGSNTEPIVRIIAEATSRPRADALVEKMKTILDSVE